MQSYEVAGGVLFALGVAFVFANLYVFLVHTAIFPIVFVCEFIPLLVYRVCTYYHFRWHHYCLDFCYCLNVLHIIYVLFMPHNRWLFTCIFVLGNGPSVWGALLFTNKLVFHDIESMFSLIMHIGPALATHAERFYWDHNNFGCPMNEDNCYAATKLWSLWAVPCAVYCAHLILYTIYVWVLPIHQGLQNDPRYDNTFLYLRQTYAGGNPSSVIYQLLNMFGASFAAQYCSFALLNLLLACVLSAFAVACFQHRIVHVAILLLVGVSGSYFGGTFYFHFFERRYFAKFFASKPWTRGGGVNRFNFPLPFLPPPSAIGSDKHSHDDYASGAGEHNHQPPASASSSEETGTSDTVEKAIITTHQQPLQQHQQSAKVLPE